jgi:hypothetical protein
MQLQIALSAVFAALVATDSNINLPPYDRSSLQRSTLAPKTITISTKPTTSAKAYNAYVFDDSLPILQSETSISTKPTTSAKAYYADVFEDSLPILQSETSFSAKAYITATSSAKGYQNDGPYASPTPEISIDNLPLAVSTTYRATYATESSSTDSASGIVSGEISAQVISLPMFGILFVANFFLLL